MVIFIELVQYAKNLGGKFRKNLVEHKVKKMIRKFNSIICPVFAPHSQNNTFSLLHNIQSMQHFFTILAPLNLNRTTLELFLSLNQRLSI